MIDILMATYNGEKYLTEQIESIINQTYQDWRLIIADDCSSDSTIKILEKYHAKYPNKISYYQNSKPSGSAKNNFLQLLGQAKSDYVMFSDQDDVWLDDKIEKSIKKIKEIEEGVETNKAILCFSDLTVVDNKLNIISYKMSNFQSLNMSRFEFKDLMIQNIVTGCTMIINRALIKKIKLPIDNNKIIMHDWWIALIASRFGTIGYIDNSYILYRQHNNNSVGAKKINSIRYIYNKISSAKSMRESLFLTQEQIRLFMELYKIDDDLLREYTKLNTYTKIDKIKFIVKNKIWKHGLIRNLGLIIYI